MTQISSKSTCGRHLSCAWYKRKINKTKMLGKSCFLISTRTSEAMNSNRRSIIQLEVKSTTLRVSCSKERVTRPHWMISTLGCRIHLFQLHKTRLTGGSSSTLQPSKFWIQIWLHSTLLAPSSHLSWKITKFWLDSVSPPPDSPTNWSAPLWKHWRWWKTSSFRCLSSSTMPTSLTSCLGSVCPCQTSSKWPTLGIHPNGNWLNKEFPHTNKPTLNPTNWTRWKNRYITKVLWTLVFSGHRTGNSICHLERARKKVNLESYFDKVTHSSITPLNSTSRNIQ